MCFTNAVDQTKNEMEADQNKTLRQSEMVLLKKGWVPRYGSTWISGCSKSAEDHGWPIISDGSKTRRA